MHVPLLHSVRLEIQWIINSLLMIHTDLSKELKDVNLHSLKWSLDISLIQIINLSLKLIGLQYQKQHQLKYHTLCYSNIRNLTAYYRRSTLMLYEIVRVLSTKSLSIYSRRVEIWIRHIYRVVEQKLSMICLKTQA